MTDAIQYIWIDLQGELRKFIISKLKDPTIAEDVLQEVFIKIHLNLHQLKDPARLTSWVYQICRNAIADQLKQSAKITSLDEGILPAANEADEDLYALLSDCINSKIARLAPKDREAVLLTYFRDYSQKDLAAFLGLSYSGAKNRVQRVREKLKLDILACEQVVADPTGRITAVREKIF